MIFSYIVIALTLVSMILAIIFNWKIKIKNTYLALYWIILSIGGILCLIFGFAPINQVADSFFSSLAINPLKILVIFISLTLLSVLLDGIGFFKYLAKLVLHKAKASQMKLFVSFYVIISLLTIITSNDIIILTFTPFICYFTKHAKINPIPYIISEFVAANTWSTFLIIGNPTNIYLGTSFGIDFITYLINMAIPTIIASATSFLILYLLFRKELKKPINIEEEYKKTKLNKSYLIISLSSLVTCIVFMAISSYINIEMWYIPLICAVISFVGCLIASTVQKRSKLFILRALKKTPFSLIPFLLSMSIIIIALQNNGFIPALANFIEGKNIILVGLISFLFANIINNIPMSMLFASTFSAITSVTSKSVFASIFASNICAFLTPVGALAGIMFMNLLKQNKIKFSYKNFILYGLVLAIPTLLVGLTTLYLI